MGSPGGGRNDVDPRFISQFCVFNLVFPADETVVRIFSAILSGHTASFDPDIRAAVPVLVQMTLELYKVNVYFQLGTLKNADCSVFMYLCWCR